MKAKKHQTAMKKHIIKLNILSSQNRIMQMITIKKTYKIQVQFR